MKGRRGVLQLRPGSGILLVEARIVAIAAVKGADCLRVQGIVLTAESNEGRETGPRLVRQEDKQTRKRVQRVQWTLDSDSVPWGVQPRVKRGVK